MLLQHDPSIPLHQRSVPARLARGEESSQFFD
jgi:hypothetical protein